MGPGHVVRRAALLAALAVLMAAAPAAAQQPAKQGAAPSLRERVLEKLRALDRASTPVPANAANDSIVADSAAADSIASVDGSPGSAVAADRQSVQGGVPGAADTAGDPGDGAPAAAAPAKGAGETMPGAAPAFAGGGGLPAVLDAPVIVHLPPDSLEAALQRLDGYTLTRYEAVGKAVFEADSGRLQLIGSPQLTREGQGLRADSLLVYDERQSVLCGYGKPVLEGTEGAPVESEQVCYNVDRRVGVALGARTQFSEAGTWFVHGKELYTAGDDRVYGAHTEFTSCDLDVPHYHFGAKSVKIVHDNIMVARDVTLHFADVPVFWLPFMVQSLKPDRRSGLLTPDFSLTDVVRTSSGMRREISNLGFFWAINDYMNAQMAFGWRSRDWKALNGRFEYNWARQFLRGGVDFTHYWMADGTELSLRTNHSWQPGERTRVNVNANFQSARFVRDYTFDPRQLNRSITSTAGLNHRFDWGSLNVSANRTQYLTDERTMTTLPSVSLSLTPITLFPAAGEARWYNNASWNGNVSFQQRRSDLDEWRPGASNRDAEERTATASSSFTIGRLSLSQGFNYAERVQGAKPLIPDTTSLVVIGDTVLPEDIQRTASWTTRLSYSQRLIGTSTFSPSISLQGQLASPDSLGGQWIAGPTRVQFGAGLSTNIFGFWPGFGPISRLRHRIEPSLSYSYSPVPQLTDLQRAVFGDQAGAETNQITLTINQTWEAKYAESDTVGQGAAADTVTDRSGEPRRLPQGRKITLLSLRTSAMAYDFVRARNGDYGFTTTRLTHSISSDLLRGLSLTVGHDLFRIDDRGEGMPKRRVFAPRLRTVNASFSLDSNSWLFKVFGLGRQAAAPDTAAADTTSGDAWDAGMPVGGPGRFGNVGGGAYRSRVGDVGSWRASFDYSLIRPETGSDARGNQLLRANLSFQPTEKWSVSWNTAYSFTDGKFSDHALTLTRDLHRWQANFSFYKTQTGNISFRFYVNLLDNPDIRLDYDEQYRSVGERTGLR